MTNVSRAALAGALTGALGAAALCVSPALPAADQQFITIGTGGVTGLYYPTGEAICRLVNEGRLDHGIRCTAEATGGSIYNINTVRAGELEFGVAQSDWQFHALNGSSKFEDRGAFEDLRAVFSVHPEPFSVIVRGGDDVESFADLKGKRIYVGEPGSGLRATAEVVMDAYGMTAGDFSVASELTGAEMAQALCEDKIDVMIYTVGHPDAAISEVSSSCDVQFVDIEGPGIDKLIEESPYYRVAIIPGGMYKGLEEDTTTFGVGATLITSSQVSDEVVGAVTRAVFDNFDDFKKLHPAFGELEEEQMISDGLSAPLHDGAVAYYRERGWM